MFAHTSMKEEEAIFLWKIDDLKRVIHKKVFSVASITQYGATKLTLTGPEIIMPTRPKTKWRTFIEYFRSSFIVNYVFHTEPMEELEHITFEINYDLSVGNKENELVSIFEKSQQMGKYDKNITITFLEGSRAPNKKGTLLNGKDFILKCRFRVVTFSTALDVTNQEKPLKNDFNCLSDNFKTLYSSKTFSDFIIVVDGKSFPVHKCILSSRSPVFAAMFKSDTVEASTNKLVIEDFKTKTMEAFLLFLYTGQLGELSADEYGQLYSASDKYALVSLKKISAENLVHYISVDNVCDMYTLGHYHEDSFLKSAAITYMKENASSILISENWRNLVSQNSQIAAQMIKDAGMS